MKKIILLLALALGVEVKGQIVGGFVPINSSKSFTAGNSTFSNVIARGTLSVGSTATVTGAASITGSLLVVGQASIGVGQTNYHGAIVSSQLESTGNGYIGNKLRIGSNVTPTATLDVTGDAKVSSTFSLGSANLTGGNTGTVAVLSDAVFCLNFQWQSSTPADGATYTISTHPLVLSSSTSKQYIPVACELFSITTNYYFGSLGTTEVATLQLCQNTTVTNITTFTTSGANYLEQGVSQSVNFSAGDRIAILLKDPTFATNPTVTYGSILCWFRRKL